MGYLASTTRVIKYFKPGKDGADAVRYWLVPSYTSVRVKDGKATPATVNCVLKKQVGKDTEMTVAPSAEGLAIKRCNTGSSSTSLVSYTAGDSVLVPADERYRAIQFQLYRGLNVIDTCTVAIVRDGADAIQYYLWIRYADDALGSGMSDSPISADGGFKAYIGIARNMTSPNESDDPADYVWSRFMGEQGVSLYTWIRYSDGPLSGGYPAAMYDSPKDSTMYIGIAVNQTSPTKGGDPKAYSWSKFRGDDGTSVKIKDKVEKWIPTRPDVPDYDVLWAVDSPFTVARGAQINGKPVAIVAEPEEGDIYRVESGEHAGHLICAASGRWVDLGEIQGPKGEDGEDAVSVQIAPPAVSIKKGAPTVQKVYVRVYDGKERVENFELTTINRLMGKSTGCVNFGDSGGMGYKLTCLATDDDNFELEFNVTYKNVQYPQSISVRTISDGPQGRHGPALRVQRWEKCPVGFNFQRGGEGDEYKDVVVYKSDKDRYYECIDNHPKTAGNDPVTSIQSSMGLWKVGEQFNLVATDILLAEYARIANLGVECVDICDYDEQGERETVYLYADKERLWCNYGEFKHISIDDAEITNATITSGKIAGFNISGNGLTNGPEFDNDAYVIFRNDQHNTFAGIGGNVLPTIGATKAVAAFENGDTTGLAGLDRNIAVIMNAQNAAVNHAFTGNGNGNLNGWIGGFKFSRLVTSDNTTHHLDIRENNTWLVSSTSSNGAVQLPTLSEVRNALFIGENEPFSVLFRVVADMNTKEFAVYGRNDRKASDGKYPWKSDEIPLILDWGGSVKDTLTMQEGDSYELLLVYNPEYSILKGGWSIKYSARILNKTN